MARTSISSFGFSELAAEWFESRFPAPTDVQAQSWPRILAGEHVLITAPTGSGKTLTAFLSALDQLLTGGWPAGRTSVLYISPLKALNNDIQRNLLTPLSELRELAARRGIELPDLRVLTRSGDTPSAERRRMVTRPPEILITTPESLNLILSSPRARAILSTVRTVILDEIHAIVASKRGTHLLTAIERVVLLAGEVQRIAISATVRPLDRVAAFVGGYRAEGVLGADTHYKARPVAIIETAQAKALELRVEFPDTGEALEPGATDSLWPHLVQELRRIIQRNRSTLIFVATRRHAEKLTLLINEREPEPVAYSHHGSLSRELRLYVEQSLKEGRLRAIVATNSLELGIDVGSLDEVVMIKTPLTVSSTLQRLGRAGHRVGETSRGVLFPLYGRDMIEAAAMSRAALGGEIEEVKPAIAPLDVLAQIILSMSAMETWGIDALYAALRTCTAYHELDYRQYLLVLEMLAGRYAQTRVRELNPRISIDRVVGEIKAREGVTTLLYQSGGTIPDRGYYGMRVDGGGQVGELDEEFVWERRVGESFVFGSQTWTITRITDRDVMVRPAGPDVQAIPFWRAEARGRDAHYSLVLLEFLESCEKAITTGGLDEFLRGYEALYPRTREGIASLLVAQREATGSPLPHRHHVLTEQVLNSDRSRADEEIQEVLIHTGWGGKVNEPLAMVLAARFEEESGYPLEVYADNDIIVMLLPSDSTIDEVFGPDVARELNRGDRTEVLLRERLERSGRFGALFRENAGRALLLPRGGFSRRVPLWLNRLRSKKILSATASLNDFPILLETWRNCLTEEFDLPALRSLLDELATGEVAVSHTTTYGPSPFAAEVVWRQTNLHMYKDDTMEGGLRSSLSDELIKEIAGNDALRPAIPATLVSDLRLRLQRLLPGYAPRGAEEISEWITERIVITENELSELRSATVSQHGEEHWDLSELADRHRWLVFGQFRAIASLNRPAALCAIYGKGELLELGDPWWSPDAAGSRTTVLDLCPDPDPPAPEAVLAELLRFHGPLPVDSLPSRVGIEGAVLHRLLEELVDAELLVSGRITAGSESDEICDAENLEILLRQRRAAERPRFDPVEPASLVPLWSEMTLLNEQAGNPEQLVEVLDALIGYVAPAASWEADLLPARLPGYYPLWLDGVFAEHALCWVGAGNERTTFAVEDELELTTRTVSDQDAPPGPVEQALAELPEEKASAHEIATRMEKSVSAITPLIWEAVWSGTLTASSYAALRRGIDEKFGRSAPVQRPSRSARPGGRALTSRGLRARARSTATTVWTILRNHGDVDPLEEAERARERARILLRRYGVIFRELVSREGGVYEWRELFRALRLMELSGEIVSGLFVKGVGSPQFAVRSALSTLERASQSEAVTWMSAVDPASPCGLSLGETYPELASRLPSNHLCFCGGRLLMTSRRLGRELTFLVAPDDALADACLAPLHHLVSRRWNPLPRVSIELINDLPVRESPFAPLLKAHGFRDEFKAFVLSASYR